MYAIIIRGTRGNGQVNPGFKLTLFRNPKSWSALLIRNFQFIRSKAGIHQSDSLNFLHGPQKVLQFVVRIHKMSGTDRPAKALGCANQIYLVILSP